jgi:type III secretory pathway lipoprotein EscJ
VPIYHYHAISQMTIGTIINMDGIVNMRNPVVTMEDYRYLKKLISEIDGVVICSPDNMTICSLTVLQEDKR